MVMNGDPVAVSPTSLPWQSLRLQSVEAVCATVGGIPWQAPHFAAAPDISVHTGRTSGGLGRFEPWQATPLHALPFQVGTAPRATARPANWTFTTPSRCPGEWIDEGTTWQLAHAIGSEIVGLLWDGWAAELGQGLVPVPWQAPHVPLPFPSSTRPSRCKGPGVSAVPFALASAWQFVQDPE